MESHNFVKYWRKIVKEFQVLLPSKKKGNTVSESCDFFSIFTFIDMLHLRFIIFDDENCAHIGKGKISLAMILETNAVIRKLRILRIILASTAGQAYLKSFEIPELLFAW